MSHDAFAHHGLGSATQLGDPIVLVRDNLNVHLAYGIRQFIVRQDRLTVYQLPSYALDLNPISTR